jgi:sporadic carbohydrate cluster protein (TIGR04323 family)
MSKAHRKGYRGYVTSREIGEARIPVPVQSLVLRDYCARKGLMYKLHVNENMFPHSYLVLDGLVRDMSEIEGLVMCSMMMLPKRAERRAALYQKVLVEQEAEVHLVLEDIVLRRIEDVVLVEDVLSAALLLPNCPSNIPIDLVCSDW